MLALDTEEHRSIPAEQSYWNVADHLNAIKPANFEEIVALGESRLRASMHSRAITDAPMAVALSAGLDSSLNLTFANEFQFASHSSERLSAISISLEGCPPEDDEAALAERLARDKDVRFFKQALNIERYFSLFDHLGSSLVDCPLIFTHMALIGNIVRRCRDEHIKVLLVGEGGDELGAYPVYFDSVAKYRTFKQNPEHVDAYLSEYVHMGMLICMRHCHGFPEKPKQKYWNGPAPEETTFDIMHDIMAEIEIGGEEGHVRQVLNLEYKLRLPELLLPAMDYSSMAFSVEARTAFVDHVLVGTILETPFFERNRNNSSKAWIRKVGEKSLPKYILDQPKLGFGQEFSKSIGNVLVERWEADLAAGDQPLFEFVSPDLVQDMIVQHKRTGLYGTWLFIPYAINRWLLNIERLR